MSVTGKYITQNDVDNWKNDTTQEEMQEIIDMVEQTIERITGDFFYIKTFHKFYDGNGKKAILPLMNSKILSINKLSISDSEIDTTDITATNSSGSSGSLTINLTQSDITADYYKNNYLGLYDDSETENYYWATRIISNTATSSGVVEYTLANALPTTVATGDVVSLITNWDWDSDSIFRDRPITLSEPGVDPEPWEFGHYSTFPYGARNIEVWGTMGHRSCPLNIKKSCIILCKAENDETLYSRQGYGMKSERLGDYAYIRDSSQKSNKTLTGIAEADQKLKSYIRRKPKLGAA
jgi:hypothetical protein